MAGDCGRGARTARGRRDRDGLDGSRYALRRAARRPVPAGDVLGAAASPALPHGLIFFQSVPPQVQGCAGPAPKPTPTVKGAGTGVSQSLKMSGVALPRLAGLSRLARRFPPILSGAAGMRRPSQLCPVRFRHVDAVVLGGLLDVGEGQFAVSVGNVNRLIEAGDGVSDVFRVRQWLLALLGEREPAVG